MIPCCLPVPSRSTISVLNERKNYKPAPNLGGILLNSLCLLCLFGCLFVSIVHKFALVPKSLVALVDVVEYGGA